MDASAAGQISPSEIRRIGSQLGWETRKHLYTASPEAF